MPLNLRPPLPSPLPVPVLAPSGVPVPAPATGLGLRAGRGTPPPSSVSGRARVLFGIGRRTDIDRWQFVGCNILRMRDGSGKDDKTGRKEKMHGAGFRLQE